MEDFLGMNIGDVDLKTLQRDFYTPPPKKESKKGQSEGGDHKKNSITIIQHRKPNADPKDLKKSNIEEIQMKGDCVQRRSTEMITAVQSYTDPPGEEESRSAFNSSDAAMTSQLMDLFESGILYSCSELDGLQSDGEELRMARKPSTSFGRS
ncbi:uncharacterized protein [Halyomorpha halys]|uniref:uncharacterized protein n=1 Tax=Halyomorpha halys TaxID=286706 RepID=UPI0006D4E0DE|nr:uncharacterized protein LOC106689822 [Halyomorpha halys]